MGVREWERVRLQHIHSLKLCVFDVIVVVGVLSFSRIHRCDVIISRFELVEIIMHSSHSVVFVNDWPAAFISWWLSAISAGANHICNECCPEINRSWPELGQAFWSSLPFSSTKPIFFLIQLQHCSFRRIFHTWIKIMKNAFKIIIRFTAELSSEAC